MIGLEDSGLVRIVNMQRHPPDQGFLVPNNTKKYRNVKILKYKIQRDKLQNTKYKVTPADKALLVPKKG